MPNWCCTNYVLRGENSDIKRFCDTVNSAIDKPDVCENGFGKFWLGNLCEAFGDKYGEHSGLRGVLDPTPDLYASFFGDYYDPKPIQPEPDTDTTSEVRFSLLTAWSRSEWFEDMLDRKFPDVEVGFKSTDEFGNFHDCHRPDLLGMDMYEIECFEKEVWEGFKYGEEDKAAKLLTELTGTKFEAQDIVAPAHKAETKIGDYNDAHEDDEVYLIVWEEL